MEPVKVVRLQKAALTDEDCDQLAGHSLEDNAYDVLFDGDCDIYKPDGSLLARLRQRVLPEDMCERAFPVWADAAHDTTNRGYAGGVIESQEEADELARSRGGIGARFTSATRIRPIRKDGTVSNTEVAKTVQSGIVGYFDRNPRYPYCRLTAYNLEHPRRFISVIPFIQRVDAEFMALAPRRHHAQMRYVRKTSPDFTIHGTAFTTVTVNRNFQTAVHKDVGDLRQGFGVMSALRRGRFSGCYFCFPKYRVALDMKTGCVLCADVHEWHGNTPIRGNKGMFERVSLVFYYREKMRRCGSAIEELSRAKQTTRRNA